MQAAAPFIREVTNACKHFGHTPNRVYCPRLELSRDCTDSWRSHRLRNSPTPHPRASSQTVRLHERPKRAPQRTFSRRSLQKGGNPMTNIRSLLHRVQNWYRGAVSRRHAQDPHAFTWNDCRSKRRSRARNRGNRTTRRQHQHMVGGRNKSAKAATSEAGPPGNANSIEYHVALLELRIQLLAIDVNHRLGKTELLTKIGFSLILILLTAIISITATMAAQRQLP